MKSGKLHIDPFVSFQNDEQGGFDHFFSLYYKAACFFARQYVIDPMVAEDVVAEAFVQLWKARGKIKSEVHLKNYLYRAVANLCFDHKEKAKTNKKLLENLRYETYTREDEYFKNLAKAETIRLVEQAIEKLPRQCREIFSKLFLEGKSVKETAAELKLAISTINNQKARGIKLLQIRLGGMLLAILFYFHL